MININGPPHLAWGAADKMNVGDTGEVSARVASNLVHLQHVPPTAAPPLTLFGWYLVEVSAHHYHSVRRTLCPSL